MHVRFCNCLAVNTHTSAGCLNDITGQPNDAFDEVFVNIEGVLKNDHITPLWLLKEVHHFIDQHIFTSVKIWLHALPIGAKALHREMDHK